MSKIKILHLASFSGNIGDVANHEGFYTQFEKLFNREIEIEKLEIRKFYKRWNEKQFDVEFAEYVNTFDLLVIGGGNFFELCWDYSATGTTFDIQPEILKMISTPIYVNGIGIDDNKGINKGNIRKFTSFLEILFSKENVFFTVRNDGSFEVIKKYFKEYVDKIHVIPDHGFFVNEVVEVKEYNPENEIKSIGFNIALDMSEIRYSKLPYDEFLLIIAEQINRLLQETNYNVYLFPHIQTDYVAILDLLKLIQNEFVRTRISITPLIQGQELQTFKHYKECEMIFAMRFHANVCAISMGIPTLGLISYPKHGYMYDEIGFSKRKIDLNVVDFKERVGNEINNLIQNKINFTEMSNDYKNVLRNIQQEKEQIYLKLAEWLIKMKLTK